MIEPQAGYPWRVQVVVDFKLTDTGLSQTVTATNLSASQAPIGLAGHPYLVAGPGTANDWLLEVPAQTVLLSDPERLVPQQTSPVETAGLDFRRLRPLDEAVLDHAFTDLTFNKSAHPVVRLLTVDGSGVQLTMGPQCKWVQIYTADDAGRVGVAVEPMTCAPNAFNTAGNWDRGLIVLAPHASCQATWTITPVAG